MGTESWDLAAKKLSQGCQALSLSVDESACIEFLKLMLKWNDIMNLTRITDPETMVVRHMLEALAITPHLKGNRWCDVGTGAGVPGVPLQIAHPNASVTLVDKVQKKITFLETVGHSLKLSGMTCHHGRVEDYTPTEGFSTIVTRAFAPVDKLVVFLKNLVPSGGRVLALHAPIDEETKQQLSNSGWQVSVEPLEVPFEEKARWVVVLDKK